MHINPCKCCKNSVTLHLEVLIDFNSLPSLTNHNDMSFCVARSVLMGCEDLG